MRYFFLTEAFVNQLMHIKTYSKASALVFKGGKIKSDLRMEANISFIMAFLAFTQCLQSGKNDPFLFLFSLFQYFSTNVLDR